MIKTRITLAPSVYTQQFQMWHTTASGVPFIFVFVFVFVSVFVFVFVFENNKRHASLSPNSDVAC